MLLIVHIVEVQLKDKNKEKLLTIKECYVCERKITLEKEDIIPVYALS